jgi:cytochrome P450
MQHSVWRKEFGLTYRYRVLFGSPRFYSADPVALSYILGHTDKFPKPPQMRKNMADMLGNGVLIAEGHDHRRQRKILNPSFSASAVRDMIPVFYDKAFELRDKLVSLIEDDNLAAIAAPTPAKPEDVVPGARKIDVLKFLGMATIDVIGIAGFNYDFRALHQPRNELAEAFRDMFSAGQNLTVMGIIQALVPGADLIVSYGVSLSLLVELCR